MEHFYVWFNMIAFTLMFAAFGVSLLERQRSGFIWLPSYSLYIAFYGIFLLIITFVYFTVVYFPQPVQFLIDIYVYLRMAISGLLLWFAPKFLYLYSGKGFGKTKRILTSAVAAGIVGFSFWGTVAGSLSLVRAVNLIFNGYFFGLTFYAIVKRRGRTGTALERDVMIFLYLSSSMYLLFVLAGIFLVSLPSSGLRTAVNVLASGVFCLFWSLLTIVQFARRTAVKSDVLSLSDEYVSGHGISPRERDILDLLLKGYSNKEIAAALFISVRTVETHVYNIYRKCGVKNKVELIRDVQAVLP